MKKIILLATICIRGFFLNAQCFVQISSGEQHTMAIAGNGTLWGWGSNGVGELGDGSTTNRTVPTQIGTDTNWIKVDCGAYHSMGLKSDSSLWVWGYNSNGQLGTGNSSNIYTPIQISGTWINIGAGFYHSFAISSNGTLWGTGKNEFSQLGNGDNTDIAYFEQIGIETNWKEISGGLHHSIGIKSNGTLWTVGYNQDGQLGSGNYTDSTLFAQYDASTNWIKADAGHQFSIVQNNSGNLFSFGDNSYGQLGANMPDISYNVPQSVPLGSVISFSAGARHANAAASTGNAYTWGSNSFGQGNPDNLSNNPNAPVLNATVTNAFLSCASYFNSYFITPDGTVYAWGKNDRGQVGDGTTDTKYQPTNIGITCETGSTGIDNLTTNAFSVFPNPAQDQITINGIDSGLISIYTASGILVRKHDIALTETLSVSDLNGGIYFIVTEGGQVVKFVKR